MTNRGHNEKSFRLDELAEQANRGLSRIAAAEADAIEGWLTYGAALNEGRTLFPSDEQFGQWMDQNGLRQLGGHEVHDHERAAAMWAAANIDQFEEARDAGNARTIRGLHAKWKEIEAERERAEEEARRKAEAEEKAENEEPAAPVASEAAADRQEAGCDVLPPADNTEPSSARVTSPQQGGADEDSGSGGVDAAPAPDPVRKALSALTREGLEDEVIGLREEVAELRKRVKKQTSEIADLKAKIKNYEADDKNEVIRRLSKQAESQRSAMFKANEETRRAMAAKKRAEDRVKELESGDFTL
jgi:hypothetical protein